MPLVCCCTNFFYKQFYMQVDEALSEVNMRCEVKRVVGAEPKDHTCGPHGACAQPGHVVSVVAVLQLLAVPEWFFSLVRSGGDLSTTPLPMRWTRNS